MFLEVSVFLWGLLFSSLLVGNPCREPIERQLESWNATGEILKAPGGPLGGSVYRIATSKVGVWITLHRPAGATSTTVFLTDAHGSRELAFDDRSCRPIAREGTSSPRATADGFTDTDLRELLARESRLVVFLWSPHLPLSVDGYAEIESATAALGVAFVAVVDASSDPDYVRRIAAERGVPREATKPLGSIELLFRDLPTHMPSAIAFDRTRASAPLPGYRDRASYRRWLRDFFVAEKAK